MIACIGFALLGAVLYRIRGGVTALLPYLGDTLPRIMFAVGAGAASFFSGYSLVISGCMILSAFLSEIMPNWSAEDLSTIGKKLTIAATGLARAFIMSTPFFGARDFECSARLIGAGLIAGVSVTLWKVINDAFHNADGTPHAGRTIGWPLQFVRIGSGYLIDGYWPLGEFTFGALTFLAIALGAV